MPDFPTWYKKALFNLVDTSLGEMFVINVLFFSLYARHKLSFSGIKKCV